MDNVKLNRVIVTGANSLYFGSLINLLGSVFLRFPDIDAILVYDLGMSLLERTILRGIKKVVLKQVPEFCPHYLEIEHFAWKTAAIWDALSFGNAVLWLDAGVEIQSSLEDIFLTIESDGYMFCVTPVDHPSFIIGNLSHQKSLELLGADDEIVRNSMMVNAGVMGYLRGHSASKLAFAAMKYAANPEIVKGPRNTHRHDQTIYSVLRVKNEYPAQYNLFFVENHDVLFPFLVRSNSGGYVSSKVINSWKNSDLHIYLFITRDKEPFSHIEHIEYGWNFFVINFLMKIRINEIDYKVKNWFAQLPYARNIVRKLKSKMRMNGR